MEPVSDPRVYSRRYQVTHLIAHGGMAMVYRAQDLLLNRAVALKILYPELSADPSFVERFRREAQAAAKLSHPNIVPVFDWGEDAGTYFIVMELVEGNSLADVLRGGRTLPASRTAQLSAQVAAALAYAHRHGMVHRDVKPGNILITADAQVKVADFGIAQAIASDDHLADDGHVMGTATYFSPEQAAGAAVDGRSDVYSLGVVMYEMLVGRPPFVGETPVDVASQHVNGTITPLSEVNPQVPRDLEAIVMKALGKSTATRYGSADELRADLLRFTDGQPVQASSSGAFMGEDATQMVPTVSKGERTQAVPIMQGPRRDIPRRKKNRSRVVIALSLIVIIAAAGGYYALSNHGLRTMPNLVGESETAAIATLTQGGIRNIQTKSVPSNNQRGTVTATTPSAASAISASSSIVLDISSGPVTTVTVPNVQGQATAAAELALSAVGLGYSLATASAATGEPNTVLYQSPVGNTTAQKGSTVTLFELGQGATYPVPSVAGDSLTAAAAALGGVQLTVAAKTTSICSNTIATGLVAATIPATGAQVTQGSAIELVTSTGVCQVVVPSVVGDTVSVGRSALTGQGLKVLSSLAPSDLCTGNAPGDIVSQGVAPGLTAPFGSDVSIIYCPLTSDTGASGASGASGTTGASGATGATGATG